MKKHNHSTGRLRHILHPKAHAIVFPRQDKSILLSELNTLATLNEAHIIALHKSKLISFSSAQKILKLIFKLRKNKFLVLLNKKAVRGTYLLFESYLIEKLDVDVAGSLHIGRSRNDINATTFKLGLRSYFKTIYKGLSDFRLTLLKNAKKYMNVAMPIYSQYQVAQIGTYAYYLLAIEEALARDQHCLRDLAFSLNECPLGAAAGCGTSFPIDYLLVASLLGFSRSSNNALDAVADRDFALRMLSALSIIGTHLSRIAQDYQLWTTQEFSFFALPDNLCGGSSMMPQKKNPYLFEIIKGKSSSLNGVLIQALTAMHNVPFANSVEVGTEALHGLDVVLKSMSDVLILADLLVEQAVPIQKNMTHSIQKGFAMATGMAETLVKEKKLSFKEAHYQIGLHIREVVDGNVDSFNNWLDKSNIKEYQQNEINWARSNEYGGGPGRQSTKNSYSSAKKRLAKDVNWLKDIERRWILASKKLQKKINSILEKEGSDE